FVLARAVKGQRLVTREIDRCLDSVGVGQTDGARDMRLGKILGRLAINNDELLGCLRVYQLFQLFTGHQRIAALLLAIGRAILPCADERAACEKASEKRAT